MWFVYSITSAILAALSTILEKKTLEKEHSFNVSVAIAILAAILLSPALFIHRSVDIPPMALLIMFLGSILATIAFIEVTKGIRHMEISVSAPLFLLAPLITSLMAFVFLGEKLSHIQVFGMVLLGIGTYILQTKKLSDYRTFLSHLEHDTYIKLLLFSMFLYSITSLFDRVLVTTYALPAMLVVEYSQIMIACNFMCIILYKHYSMGEIYMMIRKNITMLVLIGLCTIGYRVSQSTAASLAAGIGLVVAVKRTSSLFTTVIGGNLFREKDLVRKTLACLIMVVGVFLIAYT